MLQCFRKSNISNLKSPKNFNILRLERVVASWLVLTTHDSVMNNSSCLQSTEWMIDCDTVDFRLGAYPIWDILPWDYTPKK